MSLNKVMLIGNVGRDPIIRHLENGTPVATFSLATTERYKDKAGVLKEVTEWHNIVCWRNLADICEKFIRKGNQLYVEGSLRTRNWDDQNGQKHYVTEIIADKMRILNRKADNAFQEQSVQMQGQAARQNQTVQVPDSALQPEEEMDDLPF